MVFTACTTPMLSQKGLHRCMSPSSVVSNVLPPGTDLVAVLGFWGVCLHRGWGVLERVHTHSHNSHRPVFITTKIKPVTTGAQGRKSPVLSGEGSVCTSSGVCLPWNLVTSVARFLTGRELVPVHRPGIGDPCPTWIWMSLYKMLTFYFTLTLFKYTTYLTISILHHNESAPRQ